MASIIRSFLVFCLLACHVPAQAAILFGVVSERSAGTLAAGAQTFIEQHPGHTLILRTTAQVAQASEKELEDWLGRADAVLLIAVFGEAVPRLLPRLPSLAPDKPLLAINGDRRLTRLSRLAGQGIFDGVDDAALKVMSRNPASGDTPQAFLEGLLKRHPAQSRWLQARFYWQSRGTDNAAGLLAWLTRESGAELDVPAARPQAALRYYQGGRILTRAPQAGPRPLVAILDHDRGDQAGERDTLDDICRALAQRDLACFALLARWGQASAEALEVLRAYPQLAAVISLQDFVIGGGEARERADASLKGLDVPVLKAIRLHDREAAAWRLSEDGIAWDGVHYRVAMPELQGIGQPMVVAAGEPRHLDPLTGLALSLTRPLPAQVERLARRSARWAALRAKKNADKRLAIIYYNHPPGRHNIGADNLDVPASLLHLLRRLKAAGYDTGELPADAEALLARIQEQGINLPEQGPALRAMADKVVSVSPEQYRAWLAQLPRSLQREVSHGPLAYLITSLENAVSLARVDLGRKLLQRVMGDLRHFLEGLAHRQRERALNLLAQLDSVLQAYLAGDEQALERAESLRQALTDTGIPGLGGWGEAPGWIMTVDQRLLLPGLRFGNIFIGPQPPRGWAVDEELLHANTSFPPTHQYLAFYFWLQQAFRADALIHLGRHSTYEFLPRRRVGLSDEDYPTHIAGDIPGIYPYIVDGVGEGIQAKRRGLAVMIDHLTPPLAVTPLYDELLELRQLVESFEAAEQQPNSPARRSAVLEIRNLVDKLNLREELIAIMDKELKLRGIGFDQVDDEMLVHEVGHYLTQMQERFMPFGLHVFGRDWSREALDTMLASMAGDREPTPQQRQDLTQSPAREMAALLAALDGRFVEPGKGNDPLRTPEALPTGRNFHALDGSLLPSRLGFRLGEKLAKRAMAENPGTAEGAESVVLWASDAVRDEGAMVGFGLAMLGLEPVWNSRGIFQGLARRPLGEGVRHDMVFITSGLFRDLYANLLVWLDRAVLLALDGAALTLQRQHPDMQEALTAALAPLGDLSRPGDEPLARNRLAAHWLSEARALLGEGRSAAEAGRLASLRLFGDAPGAYGAGVNRLVERSGAWTDRQEVAQAYRLRMGHAYGDGIDGQAAQASLERRLKTVQNTYLGRASNLYGLMDNNDAFDYLGGLSLAVESLRGQAPANHVIQHADPANPRMQPLASALLGELRGRFLNPAWLKPLMEHGYAGARTMGSEFMEYLWGWQVTNPDIIQSWVWDEVQGVYLDDKLNLGLDDFLDQGANVHVKSNMLAIMLVAAHKGFWQTSEENLARLAEAFAQRVMEHGLPGSGHTHADHPMLPWAADKLEQSLRRAFLEVVEASHHTAKPEPVAMPTTIAELATVAEAADSQINELETGPERPLWLKFILGLALLGLLIGGMMHGLVRGRS